MITRIEVDGFKSLRGFAMDLEPFTVLIGPNSAGKSNVLDAPALLSRLASMPIAEAFKKVRGKILDQFSRHGGEVAPAIRFAVELLEYGDYPREQSFQSRFRYELTIERHATRKGVERLVARDERLRAMRREDDAWIPLHPELGAYAGYARAGVDAFFTLKGEGGVAHRIVGLPSLQPEESHVPSTHTALATLEYGDVVRVVRDLEGGRTFDLGAAPLGEPSERIDSGELSADASNLPTVLADLPPKVVGEIRADLVSLVPGVATFRDLLGSAFDADLPAEPEKEADPKATLRRILEEGGARRGPASVYALFGERVRFATLRALPAFQAFEAEVVAAIAQVARAQGHPA